MWIVAIILVLMIMLACEIWQNQSLTRDLAHQQSVHDKIAIRLDMLDDKIDDLLYKGDDQQCK